MQKNSNQKLPKTIAKLEQDHGKISPEVAVSNTLKDYENRRVTFSFEIYNNSQCEVAKLDKKESKKLTKELKKISSTKTRHFRHQNTSGIACKPIGNSGNYTVLFDGIKDDIEVLEIDYSGAGRVFGYLVNNIFNIVAIGKKHR
jgi:hypothetical protein